MLAERFSRTEFNNDAGHWLGDGRFRKDDHEDVTATVELLVSVFHQPTRRWLS